MNCEATPVILQKIQRRADYHAAVGSRSTNLLYRVKMVGADGLEPSTSTVSR